MLSDRDRQHILNLHAVGNGRRRISALTGIPQYDVRKVLEEQRDQYEARSRVGELPDAGDGPAVSVVVWDIETTDFKADIGRLTVSSFYHPDEDRIDTRTFRDFPDGELGLALWTLEKITAADFIIGHNVKAFDRNFLNGVLARYDAGWVPRRGWWDTMLIARYGLKGLIGNSMANLADVLELPTGKYHPSKNDWRDVLVDAEALDEIVTRCEEDVRLNYLIFVRLKPYLHKWLHRHEG